MEYKPHMLIIEEKEYSDMKDQIERLLLSSDSEKQMSALLYMNGQIRHYQRALGIAMGSLSIEEVQEYLNKHELVITTEVVEDGIPAAIINKRT